MAKTVLITQSNYIPWKGYFDAINLADEFILFDEMQYTRRDWRNRNRIVTPTGVRWITIPVRSKGRYLQTINETVVSEPEWREAHWRTLVQNYSQAPFFDMFREKLEMAYLGDTEVHLSKINERFIALINDCLGIDTRVTRCEDYGVIEGKTERLVDLCLKAGASRYLTGPAAASYLDEAQFSVAGIEVRWLEYDGYPTYPQLYGTFEHGVTILDLLFNVGPSAPEFMKSF